MITPQRRLTMRIQRIQNITLEQILPCLADTSKIRFVAAIDRDVSEILPYLNAVLLGAIYNHGARSLMIKKDSGYSVPAVFSEQ